MFEVSKDCFFFPVQEREGFHLLIHVIFSTPHASLTPLPPGPFPEPFGAHTREGVRQMEKKSQLTKTAPPLLLTVLWWFWVIHGPRCGQKVTERRGGTFPGAGIGIDAFLGWHSLYSLTS